MTEIPSTATQAGWMGCEYCGHLSPLGPATTCPRCGGTVERRKPASLSRTWALLLAAVILYIPANVLPIMRTSSLFGSSDDTILSGVVYFWHSGSPGLATLIFSVSILVPVFKMGILAVLALTVRFGWPLDRRQCVMLFHIIEFVGRWSMLDVFVVALMVGLVRFKSLAEIEAGPGAIAFGAVVALTMLATHSFDPRLIWDTPRRAHG
ncbi:paraquat-inducible protein A [Magnetospirillum sulfuroxidans]|uniref:Paraquat-inducible protein A n=1 Tax=Magnetospirillum sulfuroxidans TaxID=611300 RepID=A0ABS5IFG5_9PROT|nr:paraquat-inducible protein A [Magnetospirillum sulfuroxidans]MBR9973140.1 paraquat-inducible protein A [Magnetospirillum sulfuroxidans]